MHKVFLDTNILVHYSLGDEPECSEYKALLQHALQGKIALYASSHSLKDTYYNIALTLKRQERIETGSLSEQSAAAANEAAWGATRLLGKHLQIVPMGRSEHEHTFVFKSIHNDYEDDLQLAAAYAAKATLFVTNDKKLKEHSPVAALSSAEAVALLNAEFAPRKD